MADKTITEQLTDIEVKLETKAKADAAAAAEAAISDIKTKVPTIETDLTELKTWKVAKDEADKKNQSWIDEQIVNGKRTKAPVNEVKSFNQILADTIKRNAGTIANFRRNNPELRFDFFPEGEKDAEGKSMEVKSIGDMSDAANFKAAGDMSTAGNFPGALAVYQTVLPPVIQYPVERRWIADILPQGSSNGSQVVYPKENGIDGGVAAWTDYTQNKPQVDWNFIPATSPFVWLAGYVVIQRDMLDDIPWMTTYLQNRLLISLKLAENDFILNGVGAIPGFQDVAVTYNGSYKNSVDKIMDAAFGQLPAGTQDFYYPTNAIINDRDTLTLGLNKATGSGEYNLPAGSVTFTNGGLTIGGLDVLATVSCPWGTFYTFDKRATTFIRRIQPELRMFEDATLAKKNQIMFRIEERAALVIFNNNAIVKGVLANS